MVSATVVIPPSNKVLPGSRHLQTALFPKTASSRPGSIASPNFVVDEWVSSLRQLLSGSPESCTKLFLKESHWRDLLCMTWDFRTLQGPDQIARFIESSKGGGITGVSLDELVPHKAPQNAHFGDIDVVQAFLKIETSNGRAEGFVRLASDVDDGGIWKAFTLFTTLKELKGYEERVCSRRPTGLDRHLENEGRNWKDRLIAQQRFEGGREPTVLIIGAGQSGLSVAARLKQFGLEALIVDRNRRIGDNWRNRYHQLVLHDSVWYDHMPYLNFPPNWPVVLSLNSRKTDAKSSQVFTPKDKLAEWFEYYAGILELNVWTSTTLEESEWREDARQWTVKLLRNGEETSNFIPLNRNFLADGDLGTLHPRHVILATGHSGEPYLPSHITGIGNFKGDRLVHSSHFTKPKDDAKGKKAVVVGCCNSGHDIARDYYDHGYDVTMVQRSSTLVVTSETLIDVTMKGLYEENGVNSSTSTCRKHTDLCQPPVEDADIINMSVPSPISKSLQIAANEEMMRRDSSLLNGLATAGFALNSGPDGSGLWMTYLSRGGGYYIDVGASQLIADKKIKIRQGQEIKSIKDHSVILTDDSVLEADEIVFATGYQNMRETARKLFGDELADQVHDVWGFDDEGETRGMWRPSGHPGFWFFGGNLALCRFYSRLLALQIKAIEAGFTKPQ